MDINDALDALALNNPHDAKGIQDAQFIVNHKVRDTIFKLIGMATDENLTIADLAYIQSHLKGVIYQNDELINRKARQWTKNG